GRKVEFVFNGAFSLRGLTSGARLGGLGLAVFWKRGRAASVITGMLVSLATMTAIQLLPRLDWSKEFWMKTVGTEIFWPWYPLIGLFVTIGSTWLVHKLLPTGPAHAEGLPAEKRDSTIAR